MKKMFVTILVLSLISGIVAFVPALIFCTLMGLESDYAFIYSLGLSLGMLLVLPVPFTVRYINEKKQIEKISDELGGKCFIWRVGIVTRRNTVEGYFGFNNTSMRLIGKIKNKEYNVELSGNADAVVDFSDPVDIVIRTAKKREYRIFAPQHALIMDSLEKLGWHVVQEEEESVDE